MAPKRHCQRQNLKPAWVATTVTAAPGPANLRCSPVWWSSEMGRLACSEWQAALPTRRIGDSSPGPGPGTRIEDINVTVTVTMRRRRQLKSLRRRQVPDVPLIMQALPVPGSRAKRLICGPLRRTVGYSFKFVKNDHESRKIRPTVLQKGGTGGIRPTCLE